MKEGAKTLRVLVVDDEPPVRDITKELLQMCGHDVSVAAGAHQALEVLGRQTFDVVVTDYRMPEVTGDELARRIRKRTPKQPIVFFTGFANYVNLEGEVVVHKPIMNIRNLLDGINQAMNAPARQSSN